MKNKKAMKIGLIGTAVLTVGVAMALVASNTGLGSILRVRGIDHDANCEWNHYDAVAATYAHHGSKEFWACCSHAGQHVLTEPAEGHITDVGAFVGDYFDNLDSLDDRYIPQLEGGNKYASLDIIGWQDPAFFYTPIQYSDVQNVTFKIRVLGGEYSSWFGVGVRDDHSGWHFTTAGDVATDGEWHLVTIEIGGASGYVNFCYNMDHVMAGSIDIDDFTIVTSTNVYFDNFEGASLFTIDGGHGKIAQEEPGNKFLREDSISIDLEQVMVYSAVQYTNVTNVSFKARVPSGKGSWGGVAVASDLSIYNNTDPQYVADGTWHSYSKDFSGVTGYVEFCHEQGHFEGPLDIDDVVITYDGGKVALETFDGASIMRTRKQALCTVVSENAGKAIGTVALDAMLTTVENREYVPTFDVTKGVDDVYGSYVQLDNWQCSGSENRCWIGMTATEPLALVQSRLGSAIDSYSLYVYNPLDTSFNLMIMLKRHYTNIGGIGLAPKAWTKVTMKLGTYGSDTLAEAAELGFDHMCGSQGELLGSGWKFTSIYAEPATTPAVNPAPFGVVALDAQTGYFRDTKGYNAPHTDSHGIDDDYGAYIQIDDWKCPDNATQCWLTFSDTARSVADIEADLGSSITNYFFYIYNPLAEDFTFKIMLKSSSGMNPNMTVNCATGAWTKVTVAYGQADNGSYPALTSASQLGLTQVLGNGAVVGSGWKVTSVYAE